MSPRIVPPRSPPRELGHPVTPDHRARPRARSRHREGTSTTATLLRARDEQQQSPSVATRTATGFQRCCPNPDDTSNNGSPSLFRLIGWVRAAPLPSAWWANTAVPSSTPGHQRQRRFSALVGTAAGVQRCGRRAPASSSNGSALLLRGTGARRDAGRGICGARFALPWILQYTCYGPEGRL